MRSRPSAQAETSRLAEDPLDLVVERPRLVDELCRRGARALEQLAVGAQPREAEVGEPGLARAEQLALAAQLEVALGELEAVGRARRAPPGGRRAVSVSSSRRARDEQAVRLLRAAADAAAQLVQLGEPEAVGLLDDHDRRVRDVDADLDHGRRDEHVELAAP